jgi:subtilisin
MKTKNYNLIVTGLLLLISSGLIWNTSLSATFMGTWAQSDERQNKNGDIDETRVQAQEFAKKLRETRAVKVPNQYIVVLKDGNLPASNLRDSVNEVKSEGATVRHVYEKVIKGFTIRVTNEKVLDRILQNPRVQYVEPDTIVRAFAQTLPTGINRVDGDLSTTISGDGLGSVSVDVAVLDTGIDLNHPDLNIYKHTTFVDGTSSGNDDQGHGTMVAGIIGAKDDSQGVVGLAPGARLWSVKVLDSSGQGFVSDIIAGIEYVTSNGASIDVANLSFGGEGADSALQTAIKNSVNAGVTYVVAAGNENTDAGSIVPASFPEVIAVSAIVDTDGKCGALSSSSPYGKDDYLASFSNYGSTVDLAAPGVSIKTTSKGSSYGSFTGTSASSPHVAGAAALYIANHPDATPADVRSALRASASVPSTSCDSKGHGYFKGDRDSNAEPLLYMASSSGSSNTGTTPPTDTAPPTSTSSCGSNLPISSVRSSSSRSSFGPANAIDNKLNTKWWSTLTVKPWIRADLGAQKTVCSVNIAWADGASRQYSFVISTSTDGTSFTKVFTAKSKGTTTSAEKYTFPDKQVKYVKITITQSQLGSTKSRAQISEIDIFGGAAATTTAASATNFSTDAGSGTDFGQVSNSADSRSRPEETTKDPKISVENDGEVLPSSPTTNYPPIAKDDRVRSESVKQVLVKVLSNDRDPDADELNIISVSSPTKNGGTVIINNKDTLTYIAAADFVGIDTFSYEISDGKSKTDEARVSIIVKPIKEYGRSDNPLEVDALKKLQTPTREHSIQSESHHPRLSQEDMIVQNKAQNSRNETTSQTRNNK